MSYPTMQRRSRRPLLIALVVIVAMAAVITSIWMYTGKEDTKGAASQPTTYAQVSKDEPRDVSQFHLTTPDDQARSDYSAFIANNPAYHCPQNTHLTHLDLDKFRPCPNGMAHIRIEDGVATLVHHVGAPVQIKNNVDFLKDIAPIVNFGWSIEVDKPRMNSSFGDNGTTKTESTVAVWYQYDEVIKPFMNYVRGGNTWSVSLNTNDKYFNANQPHDIVFTWNDPRYGAGPVAMPFDWNCVATWMYGNDNPAC